MRALAAANRALAELKGRAATIPNQGILIDTLALQEAKASSEIENIVTTQDELFQLGLFPDGLESGAAKEVARYRDALKLGLKHLLDTGGLIRNATLIEMYQFLKARSDGFRSTPGTALMNDRTGEVIYVPPQDRNEIITAMSSLEAFINDDEICQLDPLIKMALIHHQFESIHPFYDGNGRTGRILNLLILQKEGLLDLPVLYFSRYITTTKGEYYRLLQEARDKGLWKEWCLYMVRGVSMTARSEIALVKSLRALMQETKEKIRNRLEKIYSQDLLNNLFRHPYTKIEFVEKELGISRVTASKYLELLVAEGILRKEKRGKTNFFINEPLFQLLSNASLR